MRVVADADRGRDNNFNLLRILAASSVLVSHSWPICLSRATPEPLINQTGYSLGIASVVIFFAVSGFFITKSFERRTLLGDFAVARIARIFPGLAVALVLTAFALGPIVTKLPVSRYLSDPGTLIYVPQNLLLAHLRFGLPGVFADAPFAGVTNGSLWTLKYEVGCYAAVVAAGFAGLLRPRAFPLLLVAASAVAIVVPGGDTSLSARVAVLVAAFAFGAAAHVYRDRVPLSAALALVPLGLAILLRDTRLYPVCYAATLAYGALVFGLADLPVLKRYNRVGDYSYGVYIYAFPVQQTLVTAFPGIRPWQMIAATIPPTLLLAVLSWRLVESPALAHRHRLAALVRRARGGPRVRQL